MLLQDYSKKAVDISVSWHFAFHVQRTGSIPQPILGRCTAVSGESLYNVTERAGFALLRSSIYSSKAFLQSGSGANPNSCKR